MNHLVRCTCTVLTNNGRAFKLQGASVYIRHITNVDSHGPQLNIEELGSNGPKDPSHHKDITTNVELLEDIVTKGTESKEDT